MWNALRVLLHRPLVADGYLHSTLPSTSKSSFAACTEAAMNIVKLVRLYDIAFSIRRAPYLISYATYVAATIHVRIAATRPAHSDAHKHLRTCLSVFEQNSETNYAVRKAYVVIEALMKHMGVSVGDPDRSRSGLPGSYSSDQEQNSSIAQFRSSNNVNQHELQQTGPVNNNRDHAVDSEPTMVAGQFVPDLDVDAIIQSFMHEQQFQGPSMYHPTDNPTAASLDPSRDGLSNNHQWAIPNEGFSMFDDNLFGFNAPTFDWNVMN